MIYQNFWFDWESPIWRFYGSIIGAFFGAVFSLGVAYSILKIQENKPKKQLNKSFLNIRNYLSKFENFNEKSDWRTFLGPIAMLIVNIHNIGENTIENKLQMVTQTTRTDEFYQNIYIHDNTWFLNIKLQNPDVIIGKFVYIEQDGRRSQSYGETASLSSPKNFKNLIPEFIEYLDLKYKKAKIKF